GFANSGSVNTGAFISGNYSNGILWRGEYQGLIGYSLDYTLPQFPLVAADVIGGIGPITVLPHIYIPPIPWGITAAGGIGPVPIPSFDIPTIHLGVNPTIDIGSITVEPFSLTTPGLILGPVTIGDVTSTSGSMSDVWLTPSYLPPIKVVTASPGGSTSTAKGFTITAVAWDSATIDFPGFTIPLDPVSIGLPLSLTIPGITVPGGAIPQLPLGLSLSNAIPAIDIPPLVVIDRIPLDLHLDSALGPVNVPIVGFGGTPGFLNTTTGASSGFFNAGGGGGSGYWNTGTGMSGWYNAMSDVSLGAASGFYNFGTQLSGILNRGAGLSGAFNTGTLGLIAAAFDSGFANVGRQLAGWLFTGIGPS
ncbi:MAG: PPE family protein, partial [Mycobacterium sp.]